jgi:hypothetical protein
MGDVGKMCSGYIIAANGVKHKAGVNGGGPDLDPQPKPLTYLYLRKFPRGLRCLPIGMAMGNNQVVIENPVINSPFAELQRHFRFSDGAAPLSHRLQNGDWQRQDGCHGDAHRVADLEQADAAATSMLSHMLSNQAMIP